MTPDSIGAAGDLATGALVGGVAEPTWNATARATDHTGSCLNCGAEPGPNYCGVCGQSAHIHSTLRSIGHDLAHGLFHFEGKVWLTAPFLLLKPGQLTRRYIAGERARFVSPLALFLFCVFLMFAAFESVGGPFHPHAMVIRNGKTLSPTEARDYLAATRQQLIASGAQRAEAVAHHAPTTKADAAMTEARDTLDALLMAQRLNAGQYRSLSMSGVKPIFGEHRLGTRIKAALANPSLLALRLQANAHKFAWVIIPISLPFVWLMFAWRREYGLYDHAVFVMYSLCAVMLLLVAMALVAATGLPTGWALFLVPLHQFLHLRGGYRVSRFGAAWRTVWLQLSAGIVLTLFAVGLAASGIAE